MKIEQIYTGCLAQGAYYIESEGEAVVIDPLRESTPYLRRAKESGAKIKYILETHFHADFVSGHIDLAEKTGATIVYGPLANPSYTHYSAKDGEILEVGKIKIKVLHTPGHTMESTTYLLLDEQDKPQAIFTGDTLFIGDVGRPDLVQAGGMTSEELAGKLYDSLRQKVMTLPDDVIVYPAHGAGSACGKNMSKETSDTLGNQKESNYALRADMSRDEFIKEVTEGLLPPPQYFAANAKINKEGYESIDAVMERGVKALSPEVFEQAANATDAIVLDTRGRGAFVKGFIPNAIFIGIDGNFAPWVGALIPDVKQPILIVAEEGREEEVVMRLARVGYDYAIGYLEGGMQAWIDSGRDIDQITTIQSDGVVKTLEAHPDATILDVRKPGEYAKQHLVEATSFPLDYINEHMNKIDRDQAYLVHCAGGYRSTIASSILKARGFENLINIQDEFSKIAAAGVKVTEEVSCSAST